MSAVSPSQSGSHDPRSNADMRVKPQVSLTLSFRQSSLTFADLRGNVCGHCADITFGGRFEEVPWPGSKPGSPTTATNAGSAATATPKAEPAPPAPTPPTALPAQHRLMIETAIDTGLRWGELIALKPRHLDLSTGKLTVQETIVEVSIKNSPTGARMLTKPYPKDNEPRTMALPTDLVTQLADSINQRQLGPGDLLFATRDGTPISRNTFRTRVWAPAVRASGVGFNVRIHDLRHAHASWLLAGGSDLRSVMDRMGHNLIQTTQKYLHPLPDADQRNLDAFRRITGAPDSK